MSLLALQSRPTFYSYDNGARVAISHTGKGRGLLAAKLLAIVLFFSGSIVAGTYAARMQSSNDLVTSGAAVSEKVGAAPAPNGAKSTAATEPNSAALQSLLNNWQKSHSGQFGVVIQELGGQKRSASLQADSSFPAASLYKLFLAQYIYSKISQGKFSLSSTVGAPSTVGVCLERMIVISDNTCGDDMAAALGWTNLSNFIHAEGFTESSTSPTLTTTASDMAKYLTELQNGTLLDPTDTQSLLGYMKQQEYRSGIPTGVPGVAVADKVGINTNIWNDAGIVYHPKGNYVLVVLSDNNNASAIANLSQQVSNFMNE